MQEGSVQERIRRAVVALGLLVLPACQPNHDLFESATGSAIDPTPQNHSPVLPEAATADLYSEGVRQFRAGGFQIAEAYFSAIVAQSPGNLPALMGLAASYDRLGRFERADEVYAEATRISGPTAQLLNNQGYSRLLRGDISGAREMFLEAYELAPEQQAIKNNLVLLTASSHLLESGPSADERF